MDRCDLAPAKLERNIQRQILALPLNERAELAMQAAIKKAIEDPAREELPR